MVAGSTSLDLAILVIAADDGVMPQTIEHLEILELLGVRLGVVALNKIDLVDDAMAELAEQEITELVAGSRFEGARIVRVSATTGEGLDALRDELEVLAGGLSPRSHEGPFRMAVQRVFKLEGIGTVVTGVPTTGSVRLGDEVELLPLDRHARVRAIQAYGGPVDEAVAGHSTALSLPDARGLELHRGCVVAAPGVFTAGTAVDIELTILARAPALEHRARVRFHTGTSEALGSLVLLDRERLPSGETVVARILLEDALCCAHGDRFLLRLVNPARTVGGGVVLRLLEHPGGRYRRAALADQVKRLVDAGSDPRARITATVAEAGPAGASPDEIAHSLAIDVGDAERLLREQPELVWHERGRRAFAANVVSAGRAELMESVDRLLRDKPLAASVKRAALRTTHTLPAALKDAVLDQLQAEGKVRAGAQGEVLFVERLAALGPADQRDLERIVALCAARGFRPPTAAELATELGLPAGRVEGLVARAVD
jgi:selenocysteine-specific elongation factor